MRLKPLLAALIAACFLLSHELTAQSVLLIPDSDNDRVSSFDPLDGSLLSADFIPNIGSFETPFNAISSGRGTIFVSDQIADSVFEFSMDGNFIGTVADASDGLDNIRGIDIFGDNLYITVGGAGGGLDNTIQVIDLLFGTQSTFANVNSPFDIFFRVDDVLVSNIVDHNIDAFDLAGMGQSPFHDSDGMAGIDFPEQISQMGTGDILVGGFGDPSGIYRFDSSGNQIASYNVGAGVRGVYELGNGNILWTSNNGVHVYDIGADNSMDVVTGAGYRFIEPVSIPEPASALALSLLGVSGLVRRRKK